MYKITLSLPARLATDDVIVVGEALMDLASAHSAVRENHAHRAAWVIEWLVEALPEEAELNSRMALVCALHDLDFGDAPVWTFGEVADVNWLAHSYSQFPPFSVGPFFIYGSHYEQGVPEGQMGLQIDAATAFGSGEHGTTKGCLQAMLDLKAQGQCPWNVLDMGTGSGILGIAAWRLWKSPVLAVDNDAEAVRVAGVHRDVNAVPAGATEMRCVCGDGFKAPDVQEKKPFDLVIANILAGSLVEMAADLVAVMDENGYVILSGILNEQADWVIAAYEAQGLVLKKMLEVGEWTTLIMKT